MKLEIEAKLQ
jgi:hypothetical protein